MVFREQDKHFLWSIFAAISIILAWKGVSEVVRSIPIISDPWILFFIGFAMLTFSGIIFREFDPLGSLDKATLKMMHYVHNHPRKHEFQIKYHDNTQKKDFTVDATSLKDIEKGFLVTKHEKNNQEKFIPLHRVTEVMHNGKSYWKL